MLRVQQGYLDIHAKNRNEHVGEENMQSSTLGYISNEKETKEFF